MALGSTQPLVKMSTRNISWGLKAAGAWGWQPHHFHVPNVMKSGKLKLLEPSGPHRACYGTPLPFNLNLKVVCPSEYLVSSYRTVPCHIREVPNFKTWIFLTSVQKIGNSQIGVFTETVTRRTFIQNACSLASGVSCTGDISSGKNWRSQISFKLCHMYG